MKTLKPFLLRFFTLSGILFLLVFFSVLLVNPYGLIPNIGLKPVSSAQGVPDLFTVMYRISSNDYETAIVGSSLTNLMDPKEVERISNTSTVNLSVSGLEVSSTCEIINLIKKKSGVKNIILCVDFWHYFKSPEYIEAGKVASKYLIDGKKNVNDIKTFFGFNAILATFKSLYLEITKQKIDVNNRAALTKKWVFSEQNAYRAYKKYNVKRRLNLDDYTFIKANYLKNLNKLHQEVKKSENINFKIFFPPCSILKYKVYEKENILDEIVNFRAAFIKTFLQEKNVKVYDFSNNKKIIENLNNYMDVYHYDQNIANKIIDELFNDSSQVTTPLSMQSKREFVKYVKSYNTKEL